MPGSFEEFDDAAWDHGVELLNTWERTLFDKELYYEIVRKVVKHCMSGGVLEICTPRKGAFNAFYRIRFADDTSALIRFPQPAYFQYAEEKLVAEVAAMRYISDHTTIPLPFILHYGMKEESPGGLGPFIIMEWVENTGDVVDVLNNPGLADGIPAVLDPNIDEKKLEHMYSQMADVLLQLSTCEFASIGSLGFPEGNEDDDPKVVGRPLSINIAQLANFGRVPHFQLPAPSTTFTSTSEYYRALADMHLQQLSFQRNQAIDSADDCRKKYIAR